MAIIIAIGVFLGDYLDNLNQNQYIYKITFSLVFIFFAIWHVLRKIIKKNEK